MLFKVIGILVMVGCFGVFAVTSGIEPGQLFNVQSLVIVFGGMALAIRFGFPYDKIKETFKAVRYASSEKELSVNPADMLADLVRIARIYRTHGPVALGRAAKKVENRFLRFGTTLIAEGYDRGSLLSALEREDNLLSNERKIQLQILRTLTRLAPALGMAGTVISLMQVMHDMSRPENLTASLGLALSSTLYGILMANLIFLPMASKLESLARKEAEERAILADALLDIHQAEHPVRIAEKLNCYDLYCSLKKESGSNGVETGLQNVAV